MPQLALFDSSDTVLVDDERGRIGYTPQFVDTVTAETWFAELRADVRWRTERRMMYDREVDVPRLLGHYRLDPPPSSVPGAVADAAERVVEKLHVPFNSVGLNLYRDGRDSVAPHNDHLYEITKGTLARAGAARGTPAPSSGQTLSAVARDPKRALTDSIALLQRSSAEFSKRGGCIGCHHQPAAALATRAARRAGVSVDEEAAREDVRMMAAQAASYQARLLQGTVSGIVIDLGLAQAFGTRSIQPMQSRMHS